MRYHLKPSNFSNLQTLINPHHSQIQSIMKNKNLNLSVLLGGCFLLMMACHKLEDKDSTVIATSVPFLVDQSIEDAYVYGEGQTSIYSDIPDIVAIFVDTIVGFDGGYGGKTGSDTIKILKSDITGWPDTVTLGGKSITFEKFNKANYKATITSNIVIAGAIPNPGPTAMEGFYLRAATGVTIELKRVFNGVYVIDNPGGAVIAPFPYLFYNYKNAAGGDSLVFPIQTNPCHGGLQLVAPGAPSSLTSAEYSTLHPPAIISADPLTLSWKVFEFPAARTTSAHTGNALCQWGTGARTFVKQ